jgi:formate dehydrogenase
MKQGAYIVNIARGAIVETEALVEVLEEGHLGGYAGDVWYPEPAPHAPSCHDAARLGHHAGGPEALRRRRQGQPDEIPR